MQTKIHFYLLIIAGIISGYFATAQDDILRDTDIEWLGSFETNFRLDPAFAAISANDNDLLTWNSVTVEKLLIPTNQYGFPESPDGLDFYWKEKLFDLLTDYTITRYHDTKLSNPMQDTDINERLYRRDTLLIVESPDNYDLIERVLISAINPGDLVGIRLNQILYLRKSTHSLGYKVISFAPLLKQTNALDSIIGYLPLGWFPAYAPDENTISELALTAPYIATTISKSSSPSMETILPLKGNIRLGQYYREFLDQAQGPVYSPDGFNLLDEATLKELSNAPADTVLTYDPETYQEKMEIISSRPLEERLKSVRLIVRWYYQAADKRLYYTLTGTGPVVEERGEHYHFLRPLFYIKNE